MLPTLTAVQAELPGVWQCQDQRRVAALASVCHELLCQLRHTTHAGFGAAVIGLGLEGLQRMDASNRIEEAYVFVLQMVACCTAGSFWSSAPARS